MSLRLPREGRGLICLSLPQLDPEALAADVVSVFGGAVVATTVALLLSGPVSIIGSEGTTIHERLRFLDAVAALLPYGYRAWYTATTWSDSSVRHRIRLAFATRPRQDAKIIRWGVVPAALSDGSPGEAYLRLLHQIREQAPDPKGLTDLIRFLAQDAEPRRFEQPEYVVDSLRKFSLGLIM